MVEIIFNLPRSPNFSDEFFICNSAKTLGSDYLTLYSLNSSLIMKTSLKIRSFFWFQIQTNFSIFKNLKFKMTFENKVSKKDLNLLFAGNLSFVIKLWICELFKINYFYINEICFWNSVSDYKKP